MNERKIYAADELLKRVEELQSIADYEELAYTCGYLRGRIDAIKTKKDEPVPA